MNPAPEIYERILHWSAPSRRSDGPVVGAIGGIFSQPDLSLSYLLAARHVLEKAEELGRHNEVALPAAYLQRHALEIAVKDLLGLAYEIDRSERWLGDLQNDASAECPKGSRVPLIHNLTDLVDRLGPALAAVNYGSVPVEIEAIAKRLREAEGDQPDRLRYSRTSRGERSFPEVTVFHLEESQHQLEAAFQRHFVVQTPFGNQSDDKTLMTALLEESMAMDEALRSILPIERW